MGSSFSQLLIELFLVLVSVLWSYELILSFKLVNLQKYYKGSQMEAFNIGYYYNTFEISLEMFS
jgi:hypothetical protein